MAGMRDWYYALVSTEVFCFLKSLLPFFHVLYYEFRNDHDSSYVAIGSAIADLELQDA